MRKFVFNAILVAAFLSIVTVIILWFTADYFLISAEKSEGRYLWQSAERKYEIATRLDPFDAEYLARYGRFLYRISPLQKDKTAYLERAENLYQRATELNPCNAYYHMGLGLVYLKEGKTAFAEFKKALKYDPGNFGIVYTVSSAAISMWGQLEPDEKEMVLSGLRYSLKVNPWYAEYIYPRLWEVTKDPKVMQKIRPVESAQDKKKKLEKIGEIKKELGNKLKLMEIDGNEKKLGEISGNLLSQSNWEGRANSGKDVYENGNMYWSGTLNRLIIVPGGKSIISIQAKGSSANGIWPYMIVELDGEEVGETFVENSEWKEFDFQIDTNGGAKILSVTFNNDGQNKFTKEDRNLFVGEIRIEID